MQMIFGLIFSLKELEVGRDTDVENKRMDTKGGKWQGGRVVV